MRLLDKQINILDFSKHHIPWEKALESLGFESVTMYCNGDLYNHVKLKCFENYWVRIEYPQAACCGDRRNVMVDVYHPWYTGLIERFASSTLEGIVNYLYKMYRIVLI